MTAFDAAERTPSRRTLVLAVLGQLATPAIAVPSADLVDVVKLGARGDGVADDTEVLAAAHASGRPVFYPRPRRFYRITRPILVKGDVQGDRARMVSVQDGSAKTTLFQIVENERPITIRGMALDGGYSGGGLGEYSAGIDIAAGREVTIEDNVILNMYGDCIYVGSKHRNQGSSAVRIRRNLLANPRRCNVAVVCAEDIVIERNRLVKSADFVAAIDLEPNRNGFDSVRGVTIADNLFDVAGRFLETSNHNAQPISKIDVLRNKGRGRVFFYSSPSAELLSAQVSRNRFVATAAHGAMLDWASVRDAMVLDNIDETPPRKGYRSVRFTGVEARLSGNRFHD